MCVDKCSVCLVISSKSISLPLFLCWYFPILFESTHNNRLSFQMPTLLLWFFSSSLPVNEVYLNQYNCISGINAITHRQYTINEGKHIHVNTCLPQWERIYCSKTQKECGSRKFRRTLNIHCSNIDWFEKIHHSTSPHTRTIKHIL